MSISNRSVVTRRGCFLGIASNTILTRVVTKCFLAGRYKTQVTGHRSGHRAQVTGHRAQVTGHRAQVTGHKAQVTGHRSQVTGHRSQGTGHRLKGTGHRAQVIGHRKRSKNS